MTDLPNLTEMYGDDERPTRTVSAKRLLERAREELNINTKPYEPPPIPPMPPMPPNVTSCERVALSSTNARKVDVVIDFVYDRLTVQHGLGLGVCVQAYDAEGNALWPSYTNDGQAVRLNGRVYSGSRRVSVARVVVIG